MADIRKEVKRRCEGMKEDVTREMDDSRSASARDLAELQTKVPYGHPTSTDRSSTPKVWREDR